MSDTPKLPATLFTEEWCMKMAEIEADDEVGAGLAARDPEIEDGNYHQYIWGDWL